MHSNSGGPIFPFSVDSSVVKLAVGVLDGGPLELPARTTLPREMGITEPSGRCFDARSVVSLSIGGAGITEKLHKNN